MTKMFTVSFRANEEHYKEIDQIMSTKRFVKPELKREAGDGGLTSVRYCVYRSDSFFLTRQLQRFNIWYELQGI